MFSGNKLLRVFMTALMVMSSPVLADTAGQPGAPASGGTGGAGGAGGSDDPAKGAPKCAKKLYDECEKLVQSAGKDVKADLGAAGAVSGDGNNRAGVKAGGDALNKGGAQLKEVGGKCEKMADKCKDACKKPEEKEDLQTCEKHFKERGGQIADSSKDLNSGGAGFGANSDARGASPNGSPAGGATDQAKPASSGGGGGGGSGMMGAMAGMAAGMMMAQMMNKKDEEKQQAAAGGVFQSDGSLNCSVAEAVNFSACNDYFASSCTAAIAAGAFSTSAGCQAFSARYCSAPNASAAQIAQAGQSGLPVVGATGEGLSANPAYCQKVMASNYCAQPGRGGCPSCMSLSAQLGAVCTANPAACLAQSSTVSLDQARTTCPTDPMFANPTYALGGGSATVVTGGSGLSTSTPVTGGSIVGGAPVVLPQSVSASSLPSDVATREGLARGTASISGGGGGSGVGSMRAQSVGGGDRVATSGAVAYNAAAANNAGPASDVQGQFGPSLFSTSSQAIRSRCESGRLNCR